MPKRAESSLARLPILGNALVILLALLLVLLVAQPAPASSTTAANVLIDSYSHYIKETQVACAQSCATGTYLFNDLAAMGRADAARENAEIRCDGSHYADVLTIIDFGQPVYNNGAYGVRDWGFAKFTYLAVGLASEYYLNAWFSSASACLNLTYVIGVNNSNMCYDASNGVTVSACDTRSGTLLAQTVKDVLAHYYRVVCPSPKSCSQPLAAGHFAPAVGHFANFVVGGSDIEVDPGFDAYAGATLNWVTGYAAAGTGYKMYDYGDTCVSTSPAACPNNGTDWNPCEVYQVAANIGSDIPVPEIYLNGWPPVWAYTATGLTTASCPNSRYQPNITPNAMAFAGVANEQWAKRSYPTTAEGWSQAMSDFHTWLGKNGYPDAAIGFASTCFPALATTWPNDDCYTYNYK